MLPNLSRRFQPFPQGSLLVSLPIDKGPYPHQTNSLFANRALHAQPVLHLVLHPGSRPRGPRFSNDSDLPERPPWPAFLFGHGRDLMART